MVKLFITEVIREDTHELYGFVVKAERQLFELLMTVSGVGASTARMIMSAFSAEELRMLIATGNTKAMAKVKGLGTKTAQRIIVDLRDKIVALGIADEIPAGGTMAAPVNNAVKDEAVSALTMLGFAPAPTQKVVVAILTEQPDLPVEQVVKLALKQIK
jgi:Holliday junction DNA helicase RuvA